MASSWCCTICRPATGRAASAASPAIRIATQEFRAGVDAGDRIRARRWAARSSIAWPAMLPAGVARDAGCGRPWSRTCAIAAPQSFEAPELGLLLEPINSRDIPGFYLSHRPGSTVLDRGRRPSDEPSSCNTTSITRSVMEGELADTIERRIWRGSATSSSPTTRAATNRAPARSTTPSCSVTSTELGYAGWIGCEYKPKRRRPKASAGLGPYLTKEFACTEPISRVSEIGRKQWLTSDSSAWASWAGRWPVISSPAATSSSSMVTAARRRRLLDKGAVACANGRDVARRGRRDHHDGAGHAGRGGRAVRPGRRRRGLDARQDRRRHELASRRSRPRSSPIGSTRSAATTSMRRSPAARSAPRRPA